MLNPRNSYRLTNCLVWWQRNLEHRPAKFALPVEDAASLLEDLPFLELLSESLFFFPAFLQIASFPQVEVKFKQILETSTQLTELHKSSWKWNRLKKKMFFK